MPNWERMRASQNWPSVLIARFRPQAEYSEISAFLDGLDERRSTLPVARLETDFRARTLTIRLESPSESAVIAWAAVVEESGLADDVSGAQLRIVGDVEEARKMTANRLLIDDGDDVLLRGSLALLREDGSEVWRVIPPQGVGDRWTEARLDGEHVTAFSWSCYRVTLDAAKGTELHRVFTK